jgi:dephospho-CoA kinase
VADEARARDASGGTRPARPAVLGLLGGIASGKSTVAAALRERGAAVLDADEEARAALEDPALVEKLVARHGRSILAADGRSIDRAALARATFDHPEHVSHLEALVHPRVRERLDRRLRRHLERADVPVVVLDVPLLLEASDLARRCDLLLFVESPAPERRKRAMARRGWTGDELDRREARQLAPEEKRRRADVVLVNDGSEAELRRKVLEWLAAAGGFEALPRRAPQGDGGRHGREES